MSSTSQNGTRLAADRQAFMRVYTQATDSDLAKTVNQFGAEAQATDIRAPETGLIMLRGRIGGGGAPFNVGEATVTRAVVQLKSGELGYGFLLGRSADKARLAAILDALAQSSVDARNVIKTVLVAPVTERVAREQAAARSKTAATRVDFFTLVRGED